ncbi:MAG: tRNA pseudouridine(38-40) synthase TruA [Kiritimatiellae bacterium]|nr:tRNA pseudouridine(38-40) synthase TruA [Kiritimatiellia bacterium]MCO5067618.1 tRNA pseudouridine(38-40) synthase TruA [Kiritimatiellia bacterium]
MSRRYRAIISYDGTDFSGWQVQAGKRTVQGVLESAIESVVCEKIPVFCSGRTDRGVHARGQVVHFDLPEYRPARKLFLAFNARLPEDVRVERIAATRPDFDARFDATGKEYRYIIWNNPVPTPDTRRTTAHVRQKLNVKEMNAAASQLVGRHDFAAFCANPGYERDGTVRTLFKLRVTKRGNQVVISALGEGFLYKMVRSLAGYLIRVGTGELSAKDAATILASKKRTARVPSAQPQGLFLWRVFYGKLPVSLP